MFEQYIDARKNTCWSSVFSKIKENLLLSAVISFLCLTITKSQQYLVWQYWHIFNIFNILLPGHAALQKPKQAPKMIPTNKEDKNL